jgi:transketolase
LEKSEPIVLSVYRPEQPVIDRKNIPEAIEANNGAYVYRNFTGSGHKLVLAISGMQILQNTLEILPELEAKGMDIKIIAVTSPELFEELRKTNPVKAKSILSDEERKLVVTLHNGWSGFMYPFMLSADYDKKAMGISHYLKSGNVEEVYDLAEMSSADIKEKILKAIG